MATTGSIRPVYEGATRWPNYFNGRLLSAEDLREDQQAVRALLRRLGRAVGAGVVEGLHVQPLNEYMVEVGAGIAVRPDGHTLELPRAVNFPVSPAEEQQARSALDFEQCAKPAGERPLPGGLYALVVGPKLRLHGDAPRVGVETVGRRPGDWCGRRWELEEVAFELIRLPEAVQQLLVVPSESGVSGEPAIILLRSLVQHWFYADTTGTATLADVAGDVHQRAGLAADQVPLAAIYWNGSAIEALDEWAVRRPCSTERGARAWTSIASEHRRGVGIARFLAFQEMVTGIQESGGTSELEARQHFHYLPPAGLLPVDLLSLSMLGTGGLAKGEAADSQDAADDIAAAAGDEASFVRSLLGLSDDPFEENAPEPEMLKLLAEALAGARTAGFSPIDFFDGMNVTIRGVASAEEARLAIDRSWLADATDLTGDPAPDIDLWIISPRQQGTDEELAKLRGDFLQILELLRKSSAGGKGASTTFMKSVVRQIRKVLSRSGLDAGHILFVRRPRDLFLAPVDEYGYARKAMGPRG